MNERITATYRVHGDAQSIEARARAIAVEQSVEMPLAAIDDPGVLRDIVGQVQSIEDRGDGSYTVRIGLAAATIGNEIGQFMNMVFGNTSMHGFVTLEDVAVTPEILTAFGGPIIGLAGLRERVGAKGRAMTCSAIKPQGLPPEKLAGIAKRFALGGIDYIKDDHGIANQGYSPFAERVRACAAAVADACDKTGRATRYVPSLWGNLDQLRDQIRLAMENGLDTVLIAPMIAGLPAFHALRREFPGIAFMGHPSFTGGTRIAPPLLLGKLFRLFGLDATIFVNHGGRFSYAPETCLAVAGEARKPWNGIAACAPVPAGGMTTGRIPEMLDFYGPDVMLLIGGDLLLARERLTEETAKFQHTVENYQHLN